MTAERDPREPSGPCPPARVPVATYRLQMNGGLRFADATALVPYLDALGISDVYTSSYLAARPGSAHGYDLVDHNQINPEIGSEEAHAEFTGALRARGLGHILDVVPNHMGIGQAANRWWNDVLEHGPSSAYAEFFDIDWDPVERHLAGKVLLPILGDQYGRVLERQELSLEYDDGTFRVRYYETALPLEPQSLGQILAHRQGALTEQLGEDHPDAQEYQSLLTALTNLPAYTERAPERARERMREKDVIRRRLRHLVDRSLAVRASIEETVRVWNGKPGDSRSFDHLDRLLAAQPYHLAHWRVATEEINYRRFFDVNELAAIRMELPAVFHETHRLILRLVEEGKVTGLRIDHPDGLYDPGGYLLALQRERFAQCERARRLAAGDRPGPELDAAVAASAAAFEAAGRGAARDAGRPLYVVAEKVLARGERLPAGWAIHGTTGYEFLNLVGGLFVDPSAARAMTSVYAGFTGLRTPWPDVVYACKQLVVETAMAAELTVLGHALARLARKSRASRDFPRRSLTDTLREVIACFPLYRTYLGDPDALVDVQDRAAVEVAVAFARRRNPTTSASLFDFVRDVLLLRLPEGADDDYRAHHLEFVRKFQQLTAPVTAKGVEDTASYRYHRLASLNEVGGDPEQFGIAVDEFHARCVARQQAWPAGLSATSTHDTKRSEDVRARIHVLSEAPRGWRDAVRRWHGLNRRHATRVEGRAVPDRNDEYLLYQTLVGAWPLSPMDEAARAAFTLRIQEYMAKAAHEAKVHTSWINPDPAYDGALARFIERILAPASSGPFLADFTAFQARVALAGMVNSLAQTLIKIGAPGVPDFYQGTELWDLSLVDPDNRRPVDWKRRAAALAEISAPAAEGQAALARRLLADWPDGRVKLHVTARALAARRQRAPLFAEGQHVPLAAGGGHAAHAVAFARRHVAQVAVVIAPRLAWRLTRQGTAVPVGASAWGDTWIALPDGLGGTLVDVLSGTPSVVQSRDGRPALDLAETLAALPVAFLVEES